MKAGLSKIVVCVILVLLCQRAFSQISGCNGAQNFCSSPGFSLTSALGNGLPGGLTISNPQTNPAGVNQGCLLTNAPGPNWMILTVGSSGLLGFSFGASGSPFPQSGFYDWAMWPYDPSTCASIFNNTLPPAACCWNGTSAGGTGMGVPPPGGSQSNFQPSIPVTAGQQFILLLSNYSGVTTSVSITSNGSAGLSCSPLLLPSVIRCPGQQAAITATWAANVSNVSYTIAESMPLNAATGNYTVQTNPTFIVSPSATHVYTVFASGTSTASSIITTNNTFTVTISPTTTMDIIAQNPAASFPNLDGNICYGAAATFTALSPGTNYTMTGAAPSPTIHSAIPVISTPPLFAGGTYTIATSLFSGCTATGAIHVNVSPNHTITVNPPLNVCQYGTGHLTATLATAPGNTYSWLGPNSYTSNAQNPVRDSMLLNMGGVYTVISRLNFNGITCPRTATALVTVVQTSSVLISASPSKTLCQASALHLSAAITGTAGFLWAGPNAFNVTAQTTTVSGLMPYSAGVYTVTANFSNGAISCPRTNTVTINVVATAIPTISLIPYNICQNDPAHLAVISSGTPISFFWFGPNSFSSTLASPTIPSVQPVASGFYYAQAFYKMGTVTCTTQTSAQMNVVQVTTVAVIPPQPACQPDNVALNASAVNAISYTWAGPDNFVSHQSNPVVFHPFTTASGIYTVTVAFGGGALVCYNSNTVAVTVNPVLNFAMSGFQLVCHETPIHIAGPAGGDSYSWVSSGGYNSTSQNADILSAMPGDEGTYSLSVSLGPCVTTHTAYVQVITPIEQVFLQPNATICKGEAITMKSEVVGGSSSIAYQWDPPLYLNSPNEPVQANVRPQTTTVYNVTVHDNWCAQSPASNVSHSFTVTVLTAERPNLQLDKNIGCQPLCLHYDAHIQNKSLITYDFIGNGTSRRLQADNFNYCIEDAGNYTLRMKTTTLDDETGKVCLDSADYPAPIVVYPKPGSAINWIPESPTLSENNVTFVASSKNGGVQTWQWLFAGMSADTISSATKQRLFDDVGKYPVMLISTNDLGCTDTIVRIMEVKEDFNVFIPNSFTPNNDNLNDVFQMKGTGVRPDGFSMEVFDRWGSLVFSTKDPQKGWDGTVKGQMAGEEMYVYKITLSGANGEGKKQYLGQVTLIR